MPTTGTERFDEVDRPPVLLEKVDPVYPELQGEKRRPSGTVWLRCRIETDGSVGKVTVVRSDGEILNAPAIAALRHWKFTPASNHGKPVAVWAALPVRVGPR